MDNGINLNCCPFCGCTNLYIVNESEELFPTVPVIFCNGCKMITKIENDSSFLSDKQTYDYLLNKLVNTWNGSALQKKMKQSEDMAVVGVDLEKHPLVIELRKEISHLTEDRNALLECLRNCVTENGICDGCKNWNGIECTSEDGKYYCEAGGSNMWEWKGK